MKHQQIAVWRWRALLLMVLLALCATLSIAIWFDNEQRRGVEATPPSTPIRFAGGPQLGVNAYNIQFEPNPADVTRTLELARQLGARYVRMQMPWDDVEIHARGDFEDRRNPQNVRNAWEKYDLIFAEMQRLDLEPIVRIDRSPDWSRPQAIATPEWAEGLAFNGNSTGPPDDYADYARFVGMVAERYRGTVRFFQIWNEPNLAYEWNWQPPNPDQFVRLLQLSTTAIRQANPEAVILFPSLSPTDGLEPSAMNELEFLDRVYRIGGADFFDILSAQAYGLGQPPDENRYIFLRRPGNWSWRRPIDTRIDVSRVVLLRELMVQHGDANKAIWISEFGYVSASANVPPERQNQWGPPVSEEQKAAYLVGQLERARREWPWIGVMNVWMLRWGGYQLPDPADPTPNFAIATRDYQPLPAFSALEQFSSAGPVAGVGTHLWSHPAVSQGADGWQLRFAGQWLELQGVTQPLTVSIGAQQVTVEPSEGVQRVFDQLPDNVHTVIVQGAAPPTGLRVGRTLPQVEIWSLVMAGCIVAILVVCGAVARSLKL
jgi:hypothetical protein